MRCGTMNFLGKEAPNDPLATSATGFCPNYIWLGITTYPHGVHRVGHHVRDGHA